jgi:hypothetical protein
MRSFPIVMTVTGYSAPLTIRTICIKNKRRQIRIHAKPDCAPRRTIVSTSNARGAFHYHAFLGCGGSDSREDFFREAVVKALQAAPPATRLERFPEETMVASFQAIQATCEAVMTLLRQSYRPGLGLCSPREGENTK